MVGSRKYRVAVSGIIFVVLVTASCARQDEISEAPPTQQTSQLRQDSEVAELLEAGQGTADLRALAEQGDAVGAQYPHEFFFIDRLARRRGYHQCIGQIAGQVDFLPISFLHEDAWT